MYSEVFPSRLKKARKDSGLTQIEISKLLKIDKSTYAKYELGMREPSYEILAMIAIELEVSIDWLLGVTANGGANSKAIIEEDRNRDEILKKIEREARLAQKLQAN